MADELNQMKIALADALTKWAELEDALALLFVEALATQEKIGFRIYFVVTAFETRLRIVHETVDARLRSEPPLWQFIEHWREMRKRIDKSKNIRNQLAHGTIFNMQRRELTATRLAKPSFQRFVEPTSDQLPGLSLHDIDLATNRFQGSIAALYILRSAILCYRTDRRNVGVLHQIVLDLAARLIDC